MTLPASGPLTISQIAAEFGVALPCVFPDDFYGKPGVPNSGALSISQFYSLSNATFTPDGGALSDEGSAFASVQLNCTAAAVWTYAGGGGGSFVSLASGSADTSIVFSLSNFTQSELTAAWTVTGTAGNVSRSFMVSLLTTGGGL